MTDPTERYALSLLKSELRDHLHYMVLDIEDKRFVVGRTRVADETWSAMANGLVLKHAMNAARHRVAETFAPEVLATLRSLPDAADVFSAEDEHDEKRMLANVRRVLASSLAAANAFEATRSLVNAFGITGTNELFHAFEGRWTPAVTITDEDIVQAATHCDGVHAKQYPSPELQTIRDSGPAAAPTPR